MALQRRINALQQSCRSSHKASYRQARSCRTELRKLAACDDTARPPRLGPRARSRACDGAERLRDPTIILLLARLGLCPSEVAHLSYEQIDRADGRLTVAGKPRREERLPLTHEVSDAIIAYVERAGPSGDSARVPDRRRSDRAAQPRRYEVRSGVRSAGLASTAAIAAHMCFGIRRPQPCFGMAASARCFRHCSPSMTAIRQGGYHPSLRDRAALGREAAVLSEDVDRYIALRQTLGKLRKPARHPRAFSGYAASRGETHVRTATVLAWVTAAGRTQEAPAERFRNLALFACFLHAEDRLHRVPARSPSRSDKPDRSPIYRRPTRSRASRTLRRQRPNPRCGASSTSRCLG